MTCRRPAVACRTVGHRPARIARRTGFTLLELLVVVGIISVLIAVLLPVLGRVREHAHRVKCSANLHSVGQALVMYTQQYGYYPGCWAFVGPNRGSRAVVWPVRLRPYLGGSKAVFNCPSQDERCWWDEDGPGVGPLGPPSAPLAGAEHLGLGYEPGEPVLVFGMYFSYGYNNLGTRAGADDRGIGDVVLTFPRGQQPGNGEVRVGRVRSASEMIAVTDANSDGNVDFVVSPLNPAWWPGRVHPTVPSPHVGGSNVLFCDGHVQWHPQVDLLTDPFPTDPVQMIRARMWNSDNQP
jgi:prepilin-type processing-associated H-X9-DG protein/prepilin-type N-terminal cleavage/methylation domain-containing protein